jgi:hypothetical protein
LGFSDVYGDYSRFNVHEDMLPGELIAEYDIKDCYPGFYKMDDLLSGELHDPIIQMEWNMIDCGWNDGEGTKMLPHDVVIGVCPNGNVVVQVVVFRTTAGYDKYLKDGIVIFDDKEL